MDSLGEAKKVFRAEIEALEAVSEDLGTSFLEILERILNCEGKVIMVGMGKPGHVASKVAATMASLGIPSFALHPAEALHGDLGMISREDIVIAISYSGESEEIIRMLPNIKLIGATIVAISGNANSTLVRYSDCAQILPEFEEACHLKLAPTSSTTAAMCYGDALAVVASKSRNFSKEDFGKFHPAGSLGKRLICKVDDLMATGENNSIVFDSAPLYEAVVELSKKGLGAVVVVDQKRKTLVGLVTDGDLRRQMERRADIYNLSVMEVMSREPIVIQSGSMAVDALNLMKKERISCLPVISGEAPVGIIRMQAIVDRGIL